MFSFKNNSTYLSYGGVGRVIQISEYDLQDQSVINFSARGVGSLKPRLWNLSAYFLNLLLTLLLIPLLPLPLDYFLDGQFLTIPNSVSLTLKGYLPSF